MAKLQSNSFFRLGEVPITVGDQSPQWEEIGIAPN